MKKFTHCPHCKRSTIGLDVYHCDHCGRIMCYYDGIFGFGSTGCWSPSNCPDCGKSKNNAPIRKIGDVVGKK